MLRDPYPRDYRAVLRNDSVVVLRGAIARNDSVVEVSTAPTSGESPSPARGVAMADVVRLEQWQQGGERVVGGTLLAVVTGSVALLVWLATSWRS